MRTLAPWHYDFKEDFYDYQARWQEARMAYYEGDENSYLVESIVDCKSWKILGAFRNAFKLDLNKCIAIINEEGWGRTLEDYLSDCADKVTKYPRNRIGTLLPWPDHWDALNFVTSHHLTAADEYEYYFTMACELVWAFEKRHNHDADKVMAAINRKGVHTYRRGIIVLTYGDGKAQVSYPEIGYEFDVDTNGGLEVIG